MKINILLYTFYLVFEFNKLVINSYLISITMLDFINKNKVVIGLGAIAGLATAFA